MARDTWYRLDNIGKYYAAQAGRRTQTVFRYAAQMDTPVNPDLLQQALDATTEKFCHFNVHLRSGLFWHYLQQVSEPVRVTPENLPICSPLQAGRRAPLFRVSYYEQRINFEVSHIISDGRGSLEFFKELLRQYVERAYGVTLPATSYHATHNESIEDAFDKHFEPQNSKAAALSRAYHVPSPKMADDPSFLEYHLPCSAVLALAHEWQVSLTSVLMCALVEAIHSTFKRRDAGRHPIRIGLPVDLRSHFGSQTTRNFFGMAYITLDTSQTLPESRELAQHIQEQITAQTQLDALKLRMNAMVKLEKNPLVRIAPVFLKDLSLYIANLDSERGVTATLSNLGRITLEPGVSTYVESVNILTSTQGPNLLACSHGDDLSLGLSTVYTNLDTIQEFVRFFSDRQIFGYINYSRATPLVKVKETAQEEGASRQEGKVLAPGMAAAGDGDIDAGGAQENFSSQEDRS